MSEDSILSPSVKLRSPFSVNVSEIAFATVVALATFFGLWGFLHSALPYPCGNFIGDVLIPCGWTEEKAWQELGLPLFSKYIVPFVLLNVLAAVSLLRVIRKDVQGFSRLGSLALVWPMFSLLGVHLLSYFSVYIFPIGLIMGIFATFISLIMKRNRLDWISIPINLLSIVSCFMYFAELLEVYGD